MTSHYFAYGSNLWPPQLGARCRSARPVATADLPGWELTFDKPSADTSAKANLRPDSQGSTPGVVYEMSDPDFRVLQSFEPRYEPVAVDVGGYSASTYVYRGEATPAAPFDWYLGLVEAGRAHHGLEPLGDIPSTPDPIAPGIRPAGPADLGKMQRILSAALAERSTRYTIHPGDLAWWMHHIDPRIGDAVSYWVQGDEAVLVIDAVHSEISLFARSSANRFAVLDWARERRPGGNGEVGWVSERDDEMVEHLESDGYQPTLAYNGYLWDLSTRPVPPPSVPDGWELRPVKGEEEADTRREASHRAFGSTMGDPDHLERYLRFMRSDAYDRRRDLVAVDPHGRVAAFMVWWPDPTGIAQIEPFGTHPGFQRQGLGTALLHYGLRQMREDGMTLARVITDEPRAATAFYEAAGFLLDEKVRWWARPDSENASRKEIEDAG